MADATLPMAVTTEQFRLDTTNFNILIEECKKLAEEMRDMKVELDATENEMVKDWVGEGSNTFQKKYHLLVMQLTDLKDDLYGISEQITTAYETYMQWDTDNAKATVGVESRY